MKGTIINAHIGEAHWVNPSGHVGSFRPNGQVLIVDEESYRANAREWTTKKSPLWAARFFVGFNVGHKPKWRMDDVVRIVKQVRTAQIGKPDASFLAQRGLYTADDGTLVDEKGAQIVILNLQGLPRTAFAKQMEELADELTHQLRQEKVIVEIQHGGVVKETFSWVPGKKKSSR